MSDLPDDPTRWPSDPFQLLGITRADDARTARRAYFRLVKKYKPDRYPEKFQKIREAYEQVQDWMKWNAPVKEETPLEDSSCETTASNSSEDVTAMPFAMDLGDPDHPADLGAQNKTQEISGDQNTPTKMDREFSEEGEGSYDKTYETVDSSISNKGILSVALDPIDLFSSSLESGDLQTAVSHINSVDASHGPAKVAQAYMTKYYLSKFLPDTNDRQAGSAGADTTEREPVSRLENKRLRWLLKSLDSSDLFQPMLHQLRKEFDRNYQLADCSTFNKFLSKQTDPNRISSLYQLRWEAIGHYKWQTVVSDIEKLKPRSLEFGDFGTGWVDLMAESMNYTIWNNVKQARQHNRDCWREISESQQHWTADSIELLILAAEEWKSNRASFEFSTVLPWARNRLEETFKRIWMPAAQSIAANPTESLRRLNQSFQRMPIAMNLLEEGLKYLSSLVIDDEDEYWDNIPEMVASFFGKSVQTDYVSNRAAMLDFCVLNHFSPMAFAYSANTFAPDSASVSWVELVQRDGPLLSVYYACRSVM